jgi:hypothetical protein
VDEPTMRYTLMAYSKDGEPFRSPPDTFSRAASAVYHAHATMNDDWYRKRIWHWHVVDNTHQRIVAWHTKGKGGLSFAYNVEQAERIGYDPNHYLVTIDLRVKRI